MPIISTLTVLILLLPQLLFAERGITVVAKNRAEFELRRTALVIGNGNYGYAPLTNPVNDAKDMAQSLRENNF